MRRALIPAALSVALVACSSVTSGPSETVALEQVGPGSGLDVAAARQAVVNFLRGYAEAAEDNGVRLATLVATRKLARWVYWLNVQNADFPGEISGEFELRTLEFAAAAPTQDTLAAQVNLGASVTINYVPESGEVPPPQVRMLDGPVTLVRRGAGDWGVIDVTRNGVSMDESIQLFDDQVMRKESITVRLDSLFTFAPYWAFNLMVENRSGKEITLDPSDASIRPRSGAGPEPLAGRGITPSIRVIPDGVRAQGSINFEAPPGPEGLVLFFPFRMGQKIVSFDFRLQRILSPTAAPTPSPTVSAPVPEPSN